MRSPVRVPRKPLLTPTTVPGGQGTSLCGITKAGYGVLCLPTPTPALWWWCGQCLCPVTHSDLGLSAHESCQHLRPSFSGMVFCLLKIYLLEVPSLRVP